MKIKFELRAFDENDDLVCQYRRLRQKTYNDAFRNHGKPATYKEKNPTDAGKRFLLATVDTDNGQGPEVVGGFRFSEIFKDQLDNGSNKVLACDGRIPGAELQNIFPGHPDKDTIRQKLSVLYIDGAFVKLDKRSRDIEDAIDQLAREAIRIGSERVAGKPVYDFGYFVPEAQLGRRLEKIFYEENIDATHFGPVTYISHDDLKNQVAHLCKEMSSSSKTGAQREGFASAIERLFQDKNALLQAKLPQPSLDPKSLGSATDALDEAVTKHYPSEAYKLAAFLGELKVRMGDAYPLEKYEILDVKTTKPMIGFINDPDLLPHVRPDPPEGVRSPSEQAKYEKMKNNVNRHRVDKQRHGAENEGSQEGAATAEVATARMKFNGESAKVGLGRRFLGSLSGGLSGLKSGFAGWRRPARTHIPEVQETPDVLGR